MRIRSSSGKLHPAIVSEASAWFVEFRAEDVTGDARERFIEWLRRSPEHIQAYLEVSGAWARLPSSDPEGKIDVEALIARSRKEPDILSLPTQTARASVSARSAVRRRMTRRLSLAAAASVAVVAVAVLAWWAAQRNVYSTGIGEQRTLQLDGSTVELNARSRIRVAFHEHERDIELIEGQALFHVAKNAQRPFVVDAGGARVRAVGTAFDVDRRVSSTIVTVVEGVVTVSTPVIPPEAGSAAPAPRAVELAAGEQLTVTARSVSRPKPADAAATAWVEKRLIFEETPLGDVAEEFNRYNARPLVIEDPQVQQLKISGIYSSTDPTSLLAFLRSQPTLQVIEENREVRIIHREPH